MLEGNASETEGVRGSMRHSNGRKIISEPWNEEEDKKLSRLVERIGKRDWCMIASVMEGRTARQCRERYCNHVDNAIKWGACLLPAWRSRPCQRVRAVYALSWCQWCCWMCARRV